MTKPYNSSKKLKKNHYCVKTIIIKLLLQEREVRDTELEIS